MSHDSHHLLSAYLDGELTADEETRVEQLLATDAAARAMFDDLRALRTTLQAMPRRRLGIDLTDRVLRRAQEAVLTDRPTAAAVPAKPALHVGDGADDSQDATPVAIPLSRVLKPSAAARDDDASGDAFRSGQRRPLIYLFMTLAAAVLVVVTSQLYFRDDVNVAQNTEKANGPATTSASTTSKVAQGESTKDAVGKAMADRQANDLRPEFSAAHNGEGISGVASTNAANQDEAPVHAAQGQFAEPAPGAAGANLAGEVDATGNPATDPYNRNRQAERKNAPAGKPDEKPHGETGTSIAGDAGPRTFGAQGPIANNTGGIDKMAVESSRGGVGGGGQGSQVSRTAGQPERNGSPTNELYSQAGEAAELAAGRLPASLDYLIVHVEVTPEALGRFDAVLARNEIALRSTRSGEKNARALETRAQAAGDKKKQATELQDSTQQDSAQPEVALVYVEAASKQIDGLLASLEAQPSEFRRLALASPQVGARRAARGLDRSALAKRQDGIEQEGAALASDKELQQQHEKLRALEETRGEADKVKPVDQPAPPPGAAPKPRTEPKAVEKAVPSPVAPSPVAPSEEAPAAEDLAGDNAPAVKAPALELPAPAKQDEAKPEGAKQFDADRQGADKDDAGKEVAGKAGAGRDLADGDRDPAGPMPVDGAAIDALELGKLNKTAKGQSVDRPDDAFGATSPGAPPADSAAGSPTPAGEDLGDQESTGQDGNAQDWGVAYPLPWFDYEKRAVDPLGETLKQVAPLQEKLAALPPGESAGEGSKGEPKGGEAKSGESKSGGAKPGEGANSKDDLIVPASPPAATAPAALPAGVAPPVIAAAPIPTPAPAAAPADPAEATPPASPPGVVAPAKPAAALDAPVAKPATPAARATEDAQGKQELPVEQEAHNPQPAYREVGADRKRVLLVLHIVPGRNAAKPATAAEAAKPAEGGPAAAAEPGNAAPDKAAPGNAAPAAPEPAKPASP